MLTRYGRPGPTVHEQHTALVFTDLVHWLTKYNNHLLPMYGERTENPTLQGTVCDGNLLAHSYRDELAIPSREFIHAIVREIYRSTFP